MRRTWPRVAIIAAVTLAGAAWLHVRGPLPLIRWTTVLDEPTPWWYSMSALPVLGMLLADWFDVWRSAGLVRRTIALALQILIVCALANLRIGVQIPVSGHTVLFAFFLTRRMLLPAGNNPLGALECAVAAAGLGAAAYAKIFWWNDAMTLVTGLAAGGLLGILSWRVARE